MEAREIFDLIVKADEAIKYATEEKGAARANQARVLLEQARREALAIDNSSLVEQADRRLADLEAITAGPAAGGPPPG